MKRKIKFLVCPLTVIAMSLFVIVGCSDYNPDPINPSILTTHAVTYITATSAVCGGNIIYDGGNEITARGVVWSTEAHPTLENHSGLTLDGTGSGIFQSKLTDLSGSTLYFVRAYATNSAGTSYGKVVTFTTTPASYMLTLEVNPEESGSATGAGEYQEGDELFIRATANEGWEFVNWTDADGVVKETPSFFYTMPADHISFTANFEMVDYTLTLFANPDEGGYVNGSGEYNYGEEILIEAVANIGVEFINWTGDTEHVDNPNSANAIVTMPSDNISLIANFFLGTVTDIDGNVYQTVIIGNQEWMAENLRVTKYNNGDDIPTDLSNWEWRNTTNGAYAIYPHGSIDGLNSNEDVLEAYGALYNWFAVDDSRGLCPSGWHAPSEAELIQLENYLVYQGYPDEQDNPSGAGNALKSCRQINSPLGGDCDTSEHPRWNSDGTHHGFDEFGFSALPSGSRAPNGSFDALGVKSLFWSSSAHVFRIMSNQSGAFHWGGSSLTMGMSVRCVKDIE